jgi:hypothetical protein
MAFLIGLAVFFFLIARLRRTSPKADSIISQIVSAFGGIFMILGLVYVFGLGLFGIAILALPWLLFSLVNPKSKRNTFFRYDRFRFDFNDDFFQNAYKHHSQKEAPSRKTNSMDLQDAATLLGISIDATEKEVKSAYRKLMLEHHPDKGGSPEFAIKLNLARDTFLKHLKP